MKARMLAGTGLGMGAALGAAGTAEAATFTVTNLNDAGPGSLRQALLDAEAAPDLDQVVFQSGLTGTIALSSGEMLVTEPVSIVGPGAGRLTLSGGSASRIFRAYQNDFAYDPLKVSGLTLANGNSGGVDGGAIYAYQAEVTLNGVILSGNRSTGNDGGAIYAEDSSLTIRSSALSGNQSAAEGGAIYTQQVDLAVINSTITGNQAGDDGGGIYHFGNGPGGGLTVTSSTISGNSAVNAAGGVWTSGSGAHAVSNSIVSGNTAPVAPDLRTDTFGAPVEVSFTLLGNASTGGDPFASTGPNVIGADPKLGPLADNGGPTPTMALLPGSPALDKGDALGEDQRGLGRPFDLKGASNAAGGNAADMGAYERVLCGKVVVSQIGTAGKDNLTGTKGPDGIVGMGGNDTIRGLAGRDGLCGGPGRDKLKGGPGNDLLIGHGGADTLLGGKGKDRLTGGKGKDKQTQ